MPRINILNSGHALPAGMTANPISARPFQPAADRLRLHMLNAAIQFIQQVVVNGAAIPGRCNAAFSALPGRRTFAQVWNDPNIWISFTGDPNPLNYGWSLVGGQDVAISNGSFVRGWRFTAASLVHELAHTNGAPAGNSPLAESTLQSCGFADMRDETVVGELTRSRPSPSRLA